LSFVTLNAHFQFDPSVFFTFLPAKGPAVASAKLTKIIQGSQETIFDKFACCL